ncbi:MAG: hypothetical protein IMZ62_13015 [Chloroflexi bacterium]|nr:hypothetical protein [Chloroflexota bacterium]
MSEGSDMTLDITIERLRRRVARFRRFGLLDGCGPEVVIERAVSIQDLAAAYSLVYRVFHDERSYIAPQQGNMRLRVFEALPETATFVAKVGGHVIAVTSLVPDSPDLGLPSDQAFGRELGQLRAGGRLVASVTNLAVDPMHRNTPVFFDLTRCCFAQAMTSGYDDLFISISPEHGVFFEHVLLFEPCGGRRSYSEKIVDIVEGKRLDLRTIERLAIDRDALLGPEAFLHDFYFSGNPFGRCVKVWAEQAARLFSAVDPLRELFVTRTGFLARCTPEELEAIRRRWGSVLGQVLAG